MAKLRPTTAFVALTALLLALLAGPSSALAVRDLHMFAGRFQNPQGLQLDPSGRFLYVANAGMSGSKCVNVPGKGVTCNGASGGVVRIDMASHDRQKLVKGLPSYGPETGNFATGVSDVSLGPDGTLYALESYAPPFQALQLPKQARKLNGSVIRISGGSAHRVADVSRFEILNDPDGQGLATNPTALDASKANGMLVADAGANDVLGISGSAVSVFGPATGPTAVTRGPAASVYVGQSNGTILQILPTGITRTYATGLSHITGLEFGPLGQLYVTEQTTTTPSADSHGAIVEIMPAGVSRCTVPFSDGLVLPVGVTVSPDGQTLYTSNYSAAPAETPNSGPFHGNGGQIAELPADPLCTG
jgi:sugar lactone lactonase YvrE